MRLLILFLFFNINLNAQFLDSDLQSFYNGLCCIAPPYLEICYKKTVNGPVSPANNTYLLPAYVGFECTNDKYGTQTGVGNFTSLWFPYNNTTPMVINDDNGANCASNVRLDQGDELAAKFIAYNGVAYSVGGGLRKLQADGLGTAQVEISIIDPNGVRTVVVSGSSNRQGGGAGWDNFGHYGSGSNYVANSNGVYTVIAKAVSVAPVRMNYFDLKVKDASAENSGVVIIKYKKIDNAGNIKYYDEANNEITGSALTQLQTDIANGTAIQTTCTF